MNSTRKMAIVTGVLFIAATLTGPILATPLTPDRTAADFLTRFSVDTTQTAAGVLFWLVSAFTGCGIAIAMYPLLRRQNVGLALAAVVFRAIEASFYLVGKVCILSLVTIGGRFSSAAAAERPMLQALGDLIVSFDQYAALVAVFAFCLGAFIYYYQLFQTHLVPRWLSAFGLIAITMLQIACVLALFSGNLITSYIPLAMPIALQEIILGGWLIVKGFNASAVAALPAPIEANGLLSAA